MASRSEPTILRLPSRLRDDGWTTVLLRMGLLLDRFERATQLVESTPDVAYWYGERALTGLLTAATWSIGGVALEEYCGKRDGDSGTNPGRGDAWLVLPNGRWYSIEAKVTGPSDLDHLVPSVRTKLARAAEQLRTIPDAYRGDSGVALCFVVPDLVSANECKGCLERMQTDLREQGEKHDWLVATYSPITTAAPYYVDGPRRAFMPALGIVAKLVWYESERPKALPWPPAAGLD
jgi:hypothetical protein